MTSASETSSTERVRRIPLLLGASIALIAVAVLAILLGRTGSSPSQAGGDALAIVQALGADAPQAAAGDAAAVDRIGAGVKRLEQITAQAGAAGWARSTELQTLASSAEAVVQARATLVDAGSALREARELLPRLVAQFGEAAAVLPADGTDLMARTGERFELRGQRIQQDLAALVSGTGDARAAARRLGENTDFMAQVINGLAGSDNSLGLPRLAGAASAPRIAALKQSFGALEAAVRRAVAAAPALPVAGKATRDLAQSALALRSELAPAASSGSVAGWRAWWPALPALLAVVPLLLLIRDGSKLRAESMQSKVVAATQRRDTDRNQEAILRLLDELSSLADGDLTVQATVTEDITGAIADSINYAVEALRGLVQTINSSAIQLEGAARQTTALAQHHVKSSNAQSKQIASATEYVGEMASSTEQVSNNAERASDVARHSVDVAHKGAGAVRRTIDGMNAIRETIQETSKRIKRLGESSQEIGNIVELINDIAEQTNILALNASIQASMAGEAGRGFAVVADEVQRLAERAANATKQIEVLVRTIQADTNEAVVSMERSTTDVVGGALLAENAGAALGEIESVSKQIASLVQNISASSRQQSQAAQSITRNMQVLREISLQTAESTSATSNSFAKLADLSTELRRSVSGFRLPEGGAGATAAASNAARAAGAGGAGG